MSLLCEETREPSELHIYTCIYFILQVIPQQISSYKINKSCILWVVWEQAISGFKWQSSHFKQCYFTGKGAFNTALVTSETHRTAAWKQSSLQRWRIVHLCYTQYNSVIQIHKGAFYNLFFHHLLMQHKANLSTQVSLKHLLDYPLTFKRNYFYSWENNSFHFPEKFWSQIIKGLQHIWEKLLPWLHHRWKNDERAMVTIDTLTHMECAQTADQSHTFSMQAPSSLSCF